MPFRALLLKMCNVVKVLQNCQEVQVNSFSARTSCQQGRGHATLDTAGPQGSALSLCFQSPSQEARKPAFKNRKGNKERKALRALFWETQQQTSRLPSCFIPWHEGSHLSAPIEVLVWERLCRTGGQRGINQSIHHKHPQHCSQVNFPCPEKCGSSPPVALP